MSGEPSVGNFNGISAQAKRDQQDNGQSNNRGDAQITFHTNRLVRAVRCNTSSRHVTIPTNHTKELKVRVKGEIKGIALTTAFVKILDCTRGGGTGRGEGVSRTLGAVVNLE